MEQDEVLKILEQTGALLSGHFELRSGLHSPRYFQCARLLCRPRIAERVCGALADEVRRQMGADPIDQVIAPALGGLIVGHEVARRLDVPFVFAEKNKEGALAMRRFRIVPGERYLVAEDVVTLGGRVQETIDLVRAGGGRVVGVAVLVDRSVGAPPFDCPMCRLLRMTPVTWQPADCPLCATGDPIEHPGS
jgi:orotate phosphoribosyltransferase